MQLSQQAERTLSTALRAAAHFHRKGDREKVREAVLIADNVYTGTPQRYHVTVGGDLIYINKHRVRFIYNPAHDYYEYH